MKSIYKLQVLLETYEINVRIIYFEKQIKKEHSNILYFLIINTTKLELIKLWNTDVQIVKVDLNFLVSLAHKMTEIRNKETNLILVR